MHTGEILFDILTWWHIGTGRGDGPVVDAAVARTPEGLPFIPGRTVKGLARETVALAVEAGFATRQEQQQWFGSGLVDDEQSGAILTPDNRERRLDEYRFRTEPGSLRFESAILGEAWARWARSGSAAAALVYGSISSTRVNAAGVADDQTLRRIEVVVPMRLRARVEGLTPRAVEVLREALPIFLRGMGSHRHRGFGRTVVTLEMS